MFNKFYRGKTLLGKSAGVLKWAGAASFEVFQCLSFIANSMLVNIQFLHSMLVVNNYNADG
jgi:hypothetical protein